MATLRIGTLVVLTALAVAVVEARAKGRAFGLGRGRGSSSSSAEEAFKMCGPLEQFVKCARPEPTCINPNPRSCKKCFAPRCQCLPGYVRHCSSGKCVKQSECPNQKCAANEEYKTCRTCEATCDNPFKKHVGKCLPAGCQCCAGFVRCRKTGQCIPSTSCVGYSCGPNEVYRNATGCEGTCAKPCTKGCVAKGEPGCECKDGYVRCPYSNRCVHPSECPKPQCPDNEVFKSCSECEATCDDQNPAKSEKCGPAKCQCAPGFVRCKATGKCIPVTTCPPEPCGENESYNKCYGCEKSCDDRGDKQCKPICGKEPKCECKAGYKRCKFTGKCIPEEKCPQPPKCKENEEYCCSRPDATCKAPYPFNLPADCEKRACLCKEGFVRSATGECISKDKCEPPKCGKNEEYKTCSGCEATCEDPDPICTKNCRKPKCECKPGYVRCKKTGECVPREKCVVPKCGENEQYMQCGGVEGTCENPDRVVAAVCRPAQCECKPGFVRCKSSGKCIPATQCPPKDCGPNEEYKQCSGEDNCSDLSAFIVPDCSKASCQCCAGYARCPLTGKCIKKELCPPAPKCCENEELKVYSGCEPTCDNPYPTECAPNPNQRQKACGCKDGYVRCPLSGRCIKKEMCSKKGGSSAGIIARLSL